MGERPDYLEPYERAARRHGAGFGALLWASPQTQSLRFEAIRQLIDLNGRRVLDVGCGRGDLLDYLIAKKVRVASYTGIEGVATLVGAARAKPHPRFKIIEADFITDPQQMAAAGADVIIFSGSLNTMNSDGFYSTLRRAYDAARETLVFNFLCSSRLAGADYLVWHPADEVMGFARTLSDRVRKLEDYLPGDCTVAMGKGAKDE